MSEKFMPGPWFIRRRKARNESVYHRRIMFGNAFEMASLRTSSDYAERKQLTWIPNDITMEANAALIAAAPELYEALEWAYRVHGEHGGPLGLGAAMAAALAKARGEESTS